MSVDATADVWWKNAVFYCLDVETYLDANGDGVGDFEGLAQRVRYLAGMGVDCLWLMPFYPTPDRDDGYDIVDFYGVDPRLGTLGDFVEFMRAARENGMRVIADLVVNHTSTRHPWFQSARESRDSPYRDFYVWRDEPPEEEPSGLVFPDAEDSNWAYDEVAGQYYLHRFYSHQPDLNITNPAVRDEIAKVVGFWLQQGLSGFRIDAVPFLLETAGVDGHEFGEPHEYLRALRSFAERRRGDAVLLGEVNLDPQGLRRFFGDEQGDELHLEFNFLANQALYLALARGDAEPLRGVLGQLPAIPADAQWANFVRNHDELTLDKLTGDERAEVFAAFGPEEELQLFGRGLRRRLPPMVAGDRRRIELAYSLAFSLPGTPVLFYGEEIGMGENLAIPGRMSVRSPMQWSDRPNAGFSTAAAGRLRAPVTEGEYGPATVNVAAQRRDPGSLLNWMERLIRRRKECPEFGWGDVQVLDAGNGAVLALRSDWSGRSLVAVHNLSASAVRTDLPLPDDDCELLEDLLGGGDDLVPDGGRVTLDLAPYAYHWLRLRRRGDALAL